MNMDTLRYPVYRAIDSLAAAATPGGATAVSTTPGSPGLIPGLSGTTTGAPLPDDTWSSLLAPGGAVAVLATALLWSAREWRKGRETRVREAEEGEEQARLRQTAAETDRDRVAGELRSKLADVEKQLVELREEMRRTLEEQESRHRVEMRGQEDRHRGELAEVRAREEVTNSENWRLRTLLTRRGYDPDTGEPLRGRRLREDEHGAADLTTPAPSRPSRSRTQQTGESRD